MIHKKIIHDNQWDSFQKRNIELPTKINLKHQISILVDTKEAFDKIISAFMIFQNSQNKFGVRQKSISIHNF